MAALLQSGYILRVRFSARTKVLVGKRVELRRHARENYRLYGEWYGDPEIWRLTSWAASPLSPAAVERLFADREHSPTDDSFAIHPKGEEAPIGVIGLMNITEANDSAELSVIVGDPEDRHQGYGAEAIAVILRYGFAELGLDRVGLSVFAFNEDAISTYEKLGFHAEGRIKKAVKRDDVFHDAIIMSIRKSEWRENPTP
jgi:RimJ/RimL family protein N-acetyltransferase